METFAHVSELRSRVGDELGVGEWITIDQEQVDTFAELTDDQQWIHVDTERARSSPFGSTIVHGYLTLACVVRLARSIYRVENFKHGLNYGLNKVRFPAPLPVGSRIRMRARLQAVNEVANGGTELVVVATVEREGSDKPVCVAETVTRYYS